MKPINLLLATLALLFQTSAFAKLNCAEQAKSFARMVSIEQFFRNNIDYSEINGKSTTNKFHDQSQLIDRINTSKLKEFVAQCGWPTKSLYGKVVVSDAWLLLQHSPDNAFQKSTLVLIENAFRLREVEPQHVAYLADRVASNEGQPQKYGTQLDMVTECEFKFKPWDSREKVEERRKALGWPTLDIYIQEVYKTFLPPSCKVGEVATELKK